MSKNIWIIATLGLLFGLISGGGIVYSFGSKKDGKIAGVSQKISSSTSQVSSSSQSVSSGTESSNSVGTSSKVQESSISSESSKSISSESKTKELNYYGWMDDDNIEVDFMVDGVKVTGQFRNITNGGKYDIEGQLADISPKYNERFDVKLFKNKLFEGGMSLGFSDIPVIQNYIQSKIDFISPSISESQKQDFSSGKIKKIHGGMNIFALNLSTSRLLLFDKDEYSKIKSSVRTLTFKGINSKDSEAYIDSAYFEIDGYYYVTGQITDSIKKLKIDNKVKINSKILIDQYTTYFIPENPNELRSPTNVRLFDITSIEKL